MFTIYKVGVNIIITVKQKNIKYSKNYKIKLTLLFLFHCFFSLYIPSNVGLHTNNQTKRSLAQITFSTKMMLKVFLTFSLLLGILLVAQAHGKEKEIGFYQLKRGDLKLNLTNYGATVVSVIVPDKHGMFYTVYELLVMCAL